VSSTSVTLTFSRLSRTHAALARPLAAGVMGANMMLFPRVLVASLVLAPSVASSLWPAFIAPALRRRHPSRHRPARQEAQRHGAPDKNPLQLREALQMAALFQGVLLGLAIVTSRFGTQGLLGSAAILGLTDVDALTMSMSKAAASNTVTAADAAAAIILGIFVNTFVKLGLALAIGRGAYRRYAAAGLTLVAAAIAAGLWVSYK
jgi:uncharacterized membrane protein (DUF4010 family)